MSWWRIQFASALIGLDMLWKEVKGYWKDIVLAVSVVFLVAASGLFLHKLITTEPVSSKPIPITQSPKVIKVETEEVQPKVVKAYKPVAKKKLNLPAQVQEDTTKVVTSAVTVDYSLLKKQTVSSVLDTETGETITYVNEEPSPWLAHRSFGSASLAYGFKGLNPAPVVRLQVTQDVLQIKSLTFGAVATVDSDSDTFVGLRGTYRW